MAKIADFGLSKFYTLKTVSSNNNLTDLDSNDNLLDLTDNVGTERYMSPEILKGNEYDNLTDIYSCGILFYELFENTKYIPGVKMKCFGVQKKLRSIIIEKMICPDSINRSRAYSLLKIINDVYP